MGQCVTSFLNVLFCSDELAHVQVVINCQYSIAHLSTREDALTYILGTPRAVY